MLVLEYIIESKASASLLLKTPPYMNKGQ